MSKTTFPENSNRFEATESGTLALMEPGDLGLMQEHSDDYQPDDAEWFELDEYRKAYAAGSHASINENWLRTVPAELRCLALDPVVEIIEGDCLDVLTQLPRRAVDLVLFNPPSESDARIYGFPLSSRQRYLNFIFKRLDAAIRHLTPSGAVWANVGDDVAAEIVMHLKKQGLHMMNWGIWHYRPGPGGNERFMESKTHCLYFSASRQNRIWNPQDILVDAQHAAERKEQSADLAAESIKQVPFDVWGLPGDGPDWEQGAYELAECGLIIRNQLPEKYLERVILACTNEGSLVLDPFLGIGATCLVAQALQRRSIGIEVDERQIEYAGERVKHAAMRTGSPWIMNCCCDSLLL